MLLIQKFLWIDSAPQHSKANNQEDHIPPLKHCDTALELTLGNKDVPNFDEKIQKLKAAFPHVNQEENKMEDPADEEAVRKKCSLRIYLFL